ncbi:hypothetical protein F5051DRAFT_396924 [Lentinula edodes]|nr:hypothetical protein F5051DRAFT_396924 [Lentinula edodes]
MKAIFFSVLSCSHSAGQRLNYRGASATFVSQILSSINCPRRWTTAIRHLRKRHEPLSFLLYLFIAHCSWRSLRTLPSSSLKIFDFFHLQSAIMQPTMKIVSFLFLFLVIFTIHATDAAPTPAPNSEKIKRLGPSGGERNVKFSSLDPSP